MKDIRAKYKPHGFLEAEPCLAPEAKAFFQEIATGKEVFEIGSGGSTLWLSQRVAKLVSLEDDNDWLVVVSVRLEELGTMADTRLVATDELHNSIDGTWDVIFVDPLINITRKRCILSAREHVKPGGWMVVDDYDFPVVARTVRVLRDAGWAVKVLSGTKIHPAKKVEVKTACAFCRKPV